jgi:uncharacterized phage-associated protein
MWQKRGMILFTANTTHEERGCMESTQICTAFDVAKYILDKAGEMTTMKLQKLVYYCQAWSLVWDERPLFAEPIEAWVNGPVVRQLYEAHRGKFAVVASDIDGDPSRLSTEQIETINSVVDYYGKRSSQYLIDLTHREEPWKKARERDLLSEFDRGSAEILLADMAEYYSSIQ